MWKKEVKIEANTTKEGVWKVWADVDNWNNWDHEVQNSTLIGNFETGSKGNLKPTSGPKSSFVITSATYPLKFTTRATLPLAKMDFVHSLTEENGKLYLTHWVEIRGFSTFLFSNVIGKKIIAELPKAMNKLIELSKK